MAKKPRDKIGDDAEGVLFSRAYLRPATAQRDSERFRTRLHFEFDHILDTDEAAELCRIVERELGVRIDPGWEPDFPRFFDDGELPDLLDAITIICRILANSTDADIAQT